MKIVTITKKKAKHDEEDDSVVAQLKASLEDLRHGRIREI